MQYKVISADCHVDLIWLPPDLFTGNAPAALKERMPYVTEGPRGREWVTKNGVVVRARRRDGLGRTQIRAGQYPPLRPHGLDRALRRRATESPPADRPRRCALRTRIATASRPKSSTASSAPPTGSTTTRRPARCCASTMTGSPISARSSPTAMAGSPTSPTTTRDAGGGRGRARRQARQCPRARSRAPARHDAAVGPLVEPGMGRDRRERLAGAFPHDRRAGPRLLEAHRQDAARRARRQHLQLPDAHGRRADVDDLRRRAAPPAADEDGDRRGRHRLDPLHPRPHGRRVGGPVQGARPDDEARASTGSASATPPIRATPSA